MLEDLGFVSRVLESKKCQEASDFQWICCNSLKSPEILEDVLETHRADSVEDLFRRLVVLGLGFRNKVLWITFLQHRII